MNMNMTDSDFNCCWSKGTDGRTRPFTFEPHSGLYDIYKPLVVVEGDDGLLEAEGGVLYFSRSDAGSDALPAVGVAMPMPIAKLGDPDFLEQYNIKYPYLAGSMANGISSVRMAEAMAKAGMLGFFGAGGLTLSKISEAVDQLQQSLGDMPFGFNLIHSPNEPELERATAELYLEKGVRLIEASAYIDLTQPLVKYRVQGIHRGQDGRVHTTNQIIAKASRTEVASRFFSPPPEPILRELVSDGSISADQAKLAEEIPMAYDLTAEADSGGHTDNQSPLTLTPTMLALRDGFMEKYHYDRPLRVGAAGGIGSPISALAAFSMGAAYIMTGSVNQSAKESGTSEMVREMLTRTSQADVTMAPAGDMFEMGVQVQVLKWGTMFAMRAARLYELYKNYHDLESLPESEKKNLEKTCFRASLDEIWDQTRNYFMERDSSQVEKAAKDPKHRMALIFRWYLGQSTGWANSGNESRKIDFQIFCGPAMGAFNEWVKGTFLEAHQNRDVVTVAMNFLYGAAVLHRIQFLRSQGAPIPMRTDVVKPMKLQKIKEYLQ